MTKKISELGAANLPLTGTEEVLFVQAGVTRRAPASAFPRTIFTGIIDQGSLGTTQHDDLVLDDSLSDNTRVHLTATADTASITGVVAAGDGALMVMTNISAFIITLMAEHGDSEASNRFAMNGDHLLLPNCSAWFMYVEAINRWSRIG
jgi:hypothetical protein